MNKILEIIPTFIENLFRVQLIKDNLIRVQIQIIKDLIQVEIKIFYAI